MQWIKIAPLRSAILTTDVGVVHHEKDSLIKDMIETKRLILRAMNENDLDDMLRIFTDRKLLNAFGLDCFTRKQMKGWMDRNLDHQKEHGYGLLEAAKAIKEYSINELVLQR